MKEQLENMLQAHEDGVYKFSVRANCDELVSSLYKEIIRLRKIILKQADKEAARMKIDFD